MLIDKFDRNGECIDDTKTYQDVINNVTDIKIINIDSIWYAIPDGLDEEKLDDVITGLVQQ